MSPHLRGDWSARRAPWWFALMTQVVVIWVTLWRGQDYAAGDRPSLRSQLGAVERFFDIQIWGVAFLVAAAVMLTGLVLARPSTIITGHMMSCGLYLAVACGVVTDTIPARALDGSRTPNELAAFGVLSFGVALWTFLTTIDDDLRERKWREVLEHE